MSEALEVESAIQAITAAYNWQASPEVRKLSLERFEQLKQRKIEVSLKVSISLIQSKDKELEVQLIGYQLLQYLVRARSSDFNPGDVNSLVQFAFSQFQSTGQPAQPWLLKSKSASLLADVIKQTGPDLFSQLITPIFTSAQSSPFQAENTALLLRFLAEDITVHNEDLQAETRKSLLSVLTSAVPQITAFLFSALEANFSSLAAARQAGDAELASINKAVVTAGLSAALALGEWCPLGSLKGLVQACGFLLSSPEFRFPACEFLKQIAARRRDSAEPSDFEAAVCQAFDSVVSASLTSIAVLEQASSKSEVDFAVKLCQTLAIMTPTNLRWAVASNPYKMEAFCRVILSYLSHPHFSLHSEALPIWLSLLRESVPDSQSANEEGPPAPQAPKPKKKVKKGAADEPEPALAVPPAAIRPLIDALVLRLSRKAHADSAQPGNDDEDDLDDASQASPFRGRLLQALRQLAAQYPLLAVSETIPLFSSCTQNWQQNPPLAAERIEKLQPIMEAVLAAVPPDLMKRSADCAASPSPALNSDQSKISAILRTVTLQLVDTAWTGPVIMAEISAVISALGPFFKYSPPEMPQILPKLFSMLTLLHPQGPSPSPAEIRSVRRCRLRICLSVHRFCKAADTALVGYLQSMATEVQLLRDSGKLSWAEQNHLGEALLYIASAAGPQQLKTVSDWLLATVKPRWASPDSWQEQCRHPVSLACFLVAEFEQSGQNQGQGLHWWLFHALSLLDKLLNRCARGTGGAHPLEEHFEWIVGPLLLLLRSLHSLWSPGVLQQCPALLQRAARMSPLEKKSLLGEGLERSNAPWGEAQPIREGQLEGSSQGEEDAVSELNNWLRVVRDAGYSVVCQLACQVSSHFYSSPAPPAELALLLSSVGPMESRHLRQWERVVAHLVRSCPRDRWQAWIGPCLGPALVRAGELLEAGWQGESSELESEGDKTKEEMVLDKLLRDLSRETCSLLTHLATCQVPATEADLSLLRFVLASEDLAVPSLRIATSALTWPDSDSCHKTVSFLSAVLHASVPSPQVQGQLAASPRVISILAGPVFSSAIRSLTLVATAAFQAEILGLLRDLYFKLVPIIAGSSEGPRQVLLSLPNVSPSVLSQFESEVSAVGSAKDQRQIFKDFLLKGIGSDPLVALRDYRGAAPIANLKAPGRGGLRLDGQAFGEGDQIGLSVFSLPN